MRLIDAEQLRAEFTRDSSELWHYTGIWAMIDCAPTAYDINEKVEQLEELIEKNVGYMRATPEANAYIKEIRDAIEIVKGGAK